MEATWIDEAREVAAVTDDGVVFVICEHVGTRWIPRYGRRDDTARPHIVLPSCFELSREALDALDVLMLPPLKFASKFERELLVNALRRNESELTHAASRHPRGTSARQLAELAVVTVRAMLHRLGHVDTERPSERAMRLSERREVQGDPRGEADR